MDKIKIDEVSSFFLVAFLLSSLLMKNGFYIFLPLLTLFVLLYNLQLKYRPGVFSLIVIQHFFQIAAGIWLCNYLDKDVDYNTASRSTATIAACIGLAFLMLPVIYFQKKIPRQDFTSLRESVNKFSSQKVFYAYVVAFFLSSLLGSVAFLFGGLTQVIFSLVKVKWLLFLLFGYQSILNNKNINIFILFVCFEFFTGFLGFFSDFKTVIFFLIVLLFSLIKKLEFRQVALIVTIGYLLGFIALAWSSIKGDYRSFLNGGQKSQAVIVERDQAVDKLLELSGNLNKDKLNDAVVGFLDRLQYTYHFAKTIDRVPEVLPFEYGKNWLASLEFTTTPRILNPDKPIYEATVKTKKYTGIKYAGYQDGVSFSLGYFPDSYIDFGLYGMMGVLFAIGALYGWFYYYMLRKASSNIIFNYATVSAFFLEFNALEMDSTYLLGRLFASMVTFFVLIKFVFPILVKWLSKSDSIDPNAVPYQL